MPRKKKADSQVRFPNQAKLISAVRVSELKMSQFELASIAKVHAQYISNMERGVSAISVGVARTLYKLGVDWQRIQQADVADYVENWRREFVIARKSKKK